MEEKLQITLPPGLLEKIDYIAEIIGFDGREQFIKAASRRTVDHYLRIMSYMFTSQTSEEGTEEA